MCGVQVTISDGINVVITIKHGVLRGDVVVTIDGCADSLSMSPLIATPGAHMEVHPVLARLDADTSKLMDSLDRWTAYMQGRGRKPSSIKQFRTVLERAAREGNWRTPHDVTFEAVTTWVGERVTSGQWKAITGDGALIAFRSYTRWAAAAQILPRDPLILAHTSGAESEPGARAATTEEARALIAYALNAQRTDRRTSGNRALFWYLMFTQGLRAGELGGEERGPTPRGWRWGDLILTEKIPAIVWRPDMHKNAKHVVTPLHPRVAEMLLAHREGVQHAPADPVFPVAATRSAWRKDVERAGIVHTDARGRAFTPHSARKWLKTSLVMKGVQGDVINYIMRHDGGVGDRYIDAPLDGYFAALCSIDDVWPEKIFCGFFDKSLTPHGIVPNITSATLDVSAAQPVHHAVEPGRVTAESLVSLLGSAYSRPGSTACVESTTHATQLDSPTLQSKNADSGAQRKADSKKAALAEVLRAVARLLETE